MTPAARTETVEDSSRRMMTAALGFRVHSGWATVVGVGGTPRSPVVIERRRIEIANPKISGSKQPYHSAEYLSRKEAETFVKRCIEDTHDLSLRAVRKVIDELRERRFQVIRSGIVLGSLPSAPDLNAAFASHAMAHAAEGELFRNAISTACKELKLPLVGARDRVLFAQGASDLGLSTVELRARLTELGRPLGPPWRQDEKQAALVAWLALASETH